MNSSNLHGFRSRLSQLEMQFDGQIPADLKRIAKTKDAEERRIRAQLAKNLQDKMRRARSDEEHRWAEEWYQRELEKLK